MPCAVINVAVRNWRFMAKMGITECQWFEGLNNWLAVRKVATFADVPPTISPDDPTVVRLKITFTEPGVPLPQQCTRGRMRLLSTPYSEYERLIREQLTLMFARSGFDARRDIAGIIRQSLGPCLSLWPAGLLLWVGRQGCSPRGDAARTVRKNRVCEFRSFRNHGSSRFYC